MENVIDIEAIKKLPISTRRDIIELIEESIEEDDNQELHDDGYAYETEEELKILNERLEEDLLHPEEGISWEVLENELLSRKR